MTVLGGSFDDEVKNISIVEYSVWKKNDNEG